MPVQVELVSPERILFSGEAESVTARTVGGDIAFLSGHAPFVGVLGIGEVRLNLTGGQTERVAVHGGFVEVNQNKVTVLSDVAELSGQIDVARARAAAEAARAAAAAAPGDAEAAAALRRAELRLSVAGAGADAGH